MASESNSYSAAWFQHFHADIPAARTSHEIGFVLQKCPFPAFSRVLDACCGMGRHARALAEIGYEVTGVERDPLAIEVAKELSGAATYIQCDIRDFNPDLSSFDAVIVLSQSFGYFDEETNLRILQQLGASLRCGGRVILDLWNPEFFRTRQGEHRFHLPVGEVVETKHLVEDRLFTRLEYPDGERDTFEFQTFSTDQMESFARRAGLILIESCTNFSSGLAPSGDDPKIQFVLQSGSFG